MCKKLSINVNITWCYVVSKLKKKGPLTLTSNFFSELGYRYSILTKAFTLVQKVTRESAHKVKPPVLYNEEGIRSVVTSHSITCTL